MCDRVAVDPTTHVKWAKRKVEMFAVNGRIGWPVYLPEVEATPPPAKKKKKNKKKKPRRKQVRICSGSLLPQAGADWELRAV